MLISPFLYGFVWISFSDEIKWCGIRCPFNTTDSLKKSGTNITVWPASTEVTIGKQSPFLRLMSSKSPFSFVPWPICAFVFPSDFFAVSALDHNFCPQNAFVFACLFLCLQCRCLYSKPNAYKFFFFFFFSCASTFIAWKFFFPKTSILK